jgi:two-component system nitrogen regulation sensor histidine kinase NtrY
VRALVRLDAFADTFLYVGRLVDPRVLGHMDQTRDAAKIYEELEGKRADLQISFALIFVVVALLLLLAAVWVGLAFANYLTRPIGGLIAAADRVGAGDLTARVGEAEGLDEIGSLSRSFNRMTGRLESQQSELLEANRQIDSRRRFIEAVLAGVSSGVIGLSPEGRVTHSNRRACNLLSAKPEALQGEELQNLLPGTAELVSRARRRSGRVGERQITVSESSGGSRTLLVRVAPELDERRILGFVVTLDDITELLAAQRKAAWADVARRIAHEIKNPLTPIQLSAERLKRKYLSQIENDPETFQTCTDTIVRHVGDIGRMVDEFSSFARMPAPVMDDADLVQLVDQAVFLQQLVDQAVFLQRNAHPEIKINVKRPGQPVTASCDSQQIARALTNLLQNAIDAIAAKRAEEDCAPASGRIEIELFEDESCRAIIIEDDGPGLPKAERERLTEPYITTRKKGTGLGLAIVKKIMEDHSGDLRLEDGPDGGARVTLMFPKSEDEAAPGSAQRARVRTKKESTHDA